MLAEGGNALEAMVAMAASIAVVYPHMNGIGGDGFWLLREPSGRMRALMAAGRAGEHARPELYREYETIPSRGPLAALTVPGAISGWMLALEAAKALGGALPLKVLLGHAIRQAGEGTPVARSLANLTAAVAGELKARSRLRADLPGRRQAAGGRSRAAAAGARRDARTARPCRARRFLSRRRRARGCRRSRSRRIAGDARRPRTQHGDARRAAVDRDRCRHALQHAAADAGPRLADDPRAVRRASASRRRRASTMCTG